MTKYTEEQLKAKLEEYGKALDDCRILCHSHMEIEDKLEARASQLENELYMMEEHNAQLRNNDD